MGVTGCGKKATYREDAYGEFFLNSPVETTE
jgi:hypothetical protein